MANQLTNGALVQLRVWARNDSTPQASVNSLWYFVSAVGSNPATDQDFADQMDAAVAPVYKPIIAGNSEYRGVQAIIHSAIFPYPSLFPPAQTSANAGTGTGGTQPLPSQTAGILRFLTNRAGPSGRGRIFLPFPPVDLSDPGGSPLPAYITAGLAVGAELGVGISVAIGGRSAVLLRVIVHGENKLGVVPSPTPVDDFVMDLGWGTQRRRGFYGRPNISPV